MFYGILILLVATSPVWLGLIAFIWYYKKAGFTLFHQDEETETLPYPINRVEDRGDVFQAFFAGLDHFGLECPTRIRFTKSAMDQLNSRGWAYGNSTIIFEED